MSDFVLQASNPRFLRSYNEEDEDLMDAIQTVFPLQTEYAYMIWDSIYVSFGYKYTISYLLPDVLDILDRLMTQESGSITKTLLTQEFPAIWHFQWEGNKLDIRSEWNTPPGAPAPFEAYPTLNVDKKAFISEWKQVLGVVLKALVQAGYREGQLTGMDELRRIHDAIPKPGILYRDADECADVT